MSSQLLVGDVPLFHVSRAARMVPAQTGGTRRCAVTPPYLENESPRYLGQPIVTKVSH